MEIAYHGSPYGGMEYVEPRMSTHGKEYVYATKNKALALVFIQKCNDYILNISLNDDGFVELTERVPRALEEIYKGKPGFLYQLDAKNFLEGTTSFTPEIVSEQKEKALACEKIEDSLAMLQEMEQNNEIVLFRYPERPAYIPEDKSDLIRKTKLFIQNSSDKAGVIDYAIERHPELRDQLLALSADE